MYAQTKKDVKKDVNSNFFGRKFLDVDGVLYRPSHRKPSIDFGRKRS